jgi:DNA polymerase I-like protein with 3'-5' exonuclease and polymerase domains
VNIITGPLVPRPRQRNIDSMPVELIGADRLGWFVEHLRQADKVAVDTETFHGTFTQAKADSERARALADWQTAADRAAANGSKPPKAPTEKDQLWIDLRVISVATRHVTDGKPVYGCYVLDARNLPKAGVASAMAAIDEAYGWNVDFDENVLNLYGTPVRRWRDGKLDEAVYWAGMPGRSWWLSLAEAAKRYLDYEVEGKGSTQTSYDEHSELTVDQIEYAGRDALVTLYLAEHFADMLAEADLTYVANLEQDQRPFLVEMMANGIPFDKDAWLEHIDTRRVALDEACVAIAQIVVGDKRVTSAKPNDDKVLVAVFEDGARRDLFNPDSDPQLRQAFNLHDTEAVHSKFGRLFEPTDKVDAATLKELKLQGSRLAPAVLAYRKLAKEVTTYGENFMKFWSDGRIRSRYKQAQTATGRLAADLPNPQNLPGETKRYTLPAKHRRMIAADYSQAELRCLAAMADEPAMLQPFFDGLDLHDETARQVFGVVLSDLKKTDPEAAKKMRTKVKGVNFGIPYGMQANALARRLIADGVLDGSTPEEEAAAVKEARDIIDKVMKSRPLMAAWLEKRDEFVRAFANNPGPVDWDASFKLLETFEQFEQLRRDFKRRNKRYPTARELAELGSPEPTLFDPGWDEETLAAKTADVDWAFRYDAPVVLRPAKIENGRAYHDPVAFESRTQAGRRRIFAVVMNSGYQRNEDDGGNGGKKNDMFSGLVTSAMLVAATSDKPEPCRIRDAWAKSNGVTLPQGTDRFAPFDGEKPAAFKARQRKLANEERTRCAKAFDGDKRHKKTEFVRHVCEQMGHDKAQFLLSRALADTIGALGPAFRNHPIQGAVADITAKAFAELILLKNDFPDLVWAQSVHDSIIGECDEVNAIELAVRLRTIMENAMVELFPTVPSKVDAEVCTDLSEGGIETSITPEIVQQYLVAV